MSVTNKDLVAHVAAVVVAVYEACSLPARRRAWSEEHKKKGYH